MKLQARIAICHNISSHTCDMISNVLGEWHWHTYVVTDLPRNWDDVPYVVSMCTQYGHLHVLKYLHMYCDIDIHGYNEGPLSFACRNNRYHIALYILQNGGLKYIQSLRQLIKTCLQRQWFDILKQYVMPLGNCFGNSMYYHILDNFDNYGIENDKTTNDVLYESIMNFDISEHVPQTLGPSQYYMFTRRFRNSFPVIEKLVQIAKNDRNYESFIIIFRNCKYEYIESLYQKYVVDENAYKTSTRRYFNNAYLRKKDDIRNIEFLISRMDYDVLWKIRIAAAKNDIDKIFELCDCKHHYMKAMDIAFDFKHYDLIARIGHHLENKK